MPRRKSLLAGQKETAHGLRNPYHCMRGGGGVSAAAWGECVKDMRIK